MIAGAPRSWLLLADLLAVEREAVTMLLFAPVQRLRRVATGSLILQPARCWAVAESGVVEALAPPNRR